MTEKDEITGKVNKMITDYGIHSGENLQENFSFLLEQIVNDAIGEQLGHSEKNPARGRNNVITAEFLDGLVLDFRFDERIVSSDTQLNRGQYGGKFTAMSDAMSYLDSEFIARQFLHQTTTVPLEELVRTENYDSLRDKYFRMKMYTMSLMGEGGIMKKNAINQMWGSRPHEKDIMNWRWSEGLAFLNYRERVECLLQKAMVGQGLSIISQLKDYSRMKIVREQLSNEHADMVASGQYPIIAKTIDRLNLSEDLVAAWFNAKKDSEILKD